MNRLLKTFIMGASALAAASASAATFDIDALEALGRVSEPVVSPDGRTVLYGVSYENLAENNSKRELWTMNIDGTGARIITDTPKSENGAVWINNGTEIAFLFPDDNGKPQVWVMNPDGSGRP